eukprot:GSChrysophyteH1.ASY1.ANO1.2678.1 assembled CDS
MSDSDDDIKAPPPPPGDMFGSDSDDDVAPPPPPREDDLQDSDEEVSRPKKRITSKSDKDVAEEEGGDASDDALQHGDAESVDSDVDDPSGAGEIARRKSFGPDEEDSSDDDDFDDDLDSYDDEDEEDGDEAAPVKDKSSKSRKKRSRDSGEGASKKTSKSKRKKKSNNASRFFADMADVGDEEDDEDELGERGVTEEELTAEEMAANALVEERHAKNREMMSTDAAELAARYEAQHKQERRRKKIVQEMTSGLAGVGTGTVAQQALLPSVHDPSLWRVKCQTGREFQLVRSILLRYVHQQKLGARKNTLKSAFHSGAKGFIYIEAFSEVCAKEAIMGLRGLYATSFTKVSISEMTSVISASVHKKPLREGQWVRLRRGPLRGDLARIVEILEGGSRAFVMAVPRPDYSSSATKSNVRPIQKIFDVVEAQQASGIEAERRQHKDDRMGGFFDFWRNDYYKDGFWFKDVNVESYIQGQDVKPRLEELQMFRVKKGDSESEEEEEDEDDEGEATEKVKKGSMQKQLLKELSTQMKELEGEEAAAESANIFRVDDLVEVMQGELRGLIARIVKISLTTHVLEVVPVSDQLSTRDPITVEMSTVTKHIAHGMHVKIIGGRYLGNTGRVVSVGLIDGDHIAAILTDGINSEIQVNVSNCQISAEVSIGHGDLGGFELYDCVSLSENETAVITHVGAETLRVLNHMNVVKDVYPQDITSKRNAQSSKQSAFDSSQTSISPGDIVKVVGGQDYIGKTGTVKHIMRGNLWIHSNNHLKNAGIMAIRGRSCVLAGSNSVASSSARASNMSGIQGGLNIATTQGGNRGFSKDAAIGKTVKIIRGGFKGFLAQVTDATATHFTVELLARVKKIMIERSKCKEVGNKDGAYDKTAIGGVGQTRNSDEVNLLADTATPFLTAETPMHMQGGETPAHLVGESTPFIGGETPRGQSDEMWKVNDRDKERYTNQSHQVTSGVGSYGNTYGVLRDFEITTDYWDRQFIVRFVKGPHANRHGVINDRVGQDGYVPVSLINYDGVPEQLSNQYHYTDVVLAEIKNGAHVRILHGDSRVIGFTGQVSWLSDTDVIIDEYLAGGHKNTQMSKRAHCAVVFTDA